MMTTAHQTRALSSGARQAGSGSENRQMKKTLSVRLMPDDYESLEQKAKMAGLSIAEFARRSCLGLKVAARTDLQMISELRRLGGLQKHLYNAGTEADRRRAGELILEIVDAIRRIV